MKRLLLAVLLAASLAIPQQIRMNAGRTIEGAINFCADAGANDTYTCSIATAPTAYVTGAFYFFSANTANTGAATINFNSLGAKTIKKNGGTGATDLADNDIKVGQLVMVQYDGTNMQMQSTSGNAAAGGGSAFSAITGSTNTTAAMVVGTGASIATSGTGTINGTKLVDSAQLDALLISATATSVNQFTVKPAATAGLPQLQATGTDTDISMRMVPKGTGDLRFADTGWRWNSDANFTGFKRGFANGMTGVSNAINGFIFGHNGTNAYFVGASNWQIGWTDNTNPEIGSGDTVLNRNAAGVVEVNNSTAGTYREFKARSYVVGGTAPTLTGTCSANGATGGGTAGTVTSQSTSTCTVILTFAFTAPTGWFCTASNRTTSANAIRQTASSTTTCTLSGTTVTGDVIGYHAIAY